jgi:hypothetical protein
MARYAACDICQRVYRRVGEGDEPQTCAGCGAALRPASLDELRAEAARVSNVATPCPLREGQGAGRD